MKKITGLIILMLFLYSNNSFASAVFDLPLDFSTGDGPSSLTAADFNNDGVLDIATANDDAKTVSVLIGTGSGTFLPKVDYAMVDKPNNSNYEPYPTIASGDFNGDGNADLVAANPKGFSISVYFGHGDGTFNPAVGYSTEFAPNYMPAALAVGDYNNDGLSDIVTMNRTFMTFMTFMGRSDGSFQVDVNYYTDQYGYDTRGTLGNILTGDFNKDGNLDVAYVSYWNQMIMFHYGNGDGTFSNGYIYSGENANFYGYPVVMDMADFDGDGRLDIAVIGYPNTISEHAITVHMANSVGQYTRIWTSPVITSEDINYFQCAIKAIDVNGDSIPDIISANPASDTISVYRGNGDGTFQSPERYAAGSDPIGAFNNTYWNFDSRIITDDLNNDGKGDIAVINSGNKFSVLLNIHPFDSDGDSVDDSIDNCRYVYNPGNPQPDMDGDGIGDACDDDADGDGYTTVDDCNDLDPIINPGATEVYYNGIDENCNGMQDDNDADLDGYDVSNECNDNDAAINPGATEIPYNGIDENCNGMQDDDDVDQDGYLYANDCEDSIPTINPGATEIPYNGIDENCSGMQDDDDLDQDGYPLANDCSITDPYDDNPVINPGAIEVVGNGIDDNCNGITVVSATYNATAKRLTVEASSNLGQGANLLLNGNSMTWNAGQALWSKTLTNVTSQSATVSGSQGTDTINY